MKIAVNRTFRSEIGIIQKLVYINIIICFYTNNLLYAQGVLPLNRYTVRVGTMDRSNQPSSFGYSLRKIKTGYTGFAIRVRNSTNNAIADIAFDSTNIVSVNSQATIVSSGTSGFAVGSVQSFSSFKSAANLFITRWYDQSPNAFHANQTTNANQPELLMNVAGLGNTKPSISFNGSQFLDIGQPIENVVLNGINGTFLLATKPSANSNQESFGHWKTPWTPTNWRWSFHINWSDGNIYFDAGENCCAANRATTNGSNLNLWKQYSFIRGTNYKTVRVSGTATSLNNSTSASIASSGGSFFIGWSTNALDNGYSGLLSEIIMFKTDLTTTEVIPIELDQINFWDL